MKQDDPVPIETHIKFGEKDSDNCDCAYCVSRGVTRREAWTGQHEQQRLREKARGLARYSNSLKDDPYIRW